mgnify:CR=1 FL=1
MPMSYLHTLTLISFHRLNPDWRIVVYNFIYPSEPSYAPKYIHYRGEDHFKYVRTWEWVEIHDVKVEPTEIHSILVCDKWRREVLYENGGVYSDFDVLWIKPIEYLKNIKYIGDIDNFTSLVSYYELIKGFHNVSVLISEKESPFDKVIIDEQAKVTTYYDDQAFGTTLLNRIYPELKDIPYPVLAVPYETFYPYSTYNLRQLFIDDDLSVITENTIAVHWFNGNPLAKMFINNSLYDNKCSLNSLING